MILRWFLLRVLHARLAKAEEEERRVRDLPGQTSIFIASEMHRLGGIVRLLRYEIACLEGTNEVDPEQKA